MTFYIRLRVNFKKINKVFIILNNNVLDFLLHDGVKKKSFNFYYFLFNNNNF